MHGVGYVFAAIFELVLGVLLGLEVYHFIRGGEVVKCHDVFHVRESLCRLLLEVVAQVLPLLSVGVELEEVIDNASHSFQHGHNIILVLL